MTGFEPYVRRQPSNHTPIPAGPAIAVIRQEWSGSTGTLCGDLVLSAGAWLLLQGLARYRPQVVKRPRAVELLYNDTIRGRVGIRPLQESAGSTAFEVVPAYSTVPGRRDAWPVKIVCPEFLQHWSIPEVPLDRAAPADVETGLLVFTPGQVYP